jgi:ABC-type transport system involved in multi-copper enzyme maturation permease subunit
MIGVIMKREILKYLKSEKFLIGLTVTLAIAVVATVINIRDFEQRQQDYCLTTNN